MIAKGCKKFKCLRVLIECLYLDLRTASIFWGYKCRPFEVVSISAFQHISISAYQQISKSAYFFSISAHSILVSIFFQQIQIVSIFLLSISIFSADVIHMIIAPAYAPIDSARLRMETVSPSGWRVSSLRLAFCTYGRTFLLKDVETACST